MSYNRFYFSPDTNADALLLVRWPDRRVLRIVGHVAGPLGLLALVALAWPHAGDVLAMVDSVARNLPVEPTDDLRARALVHDRPVNTW